MKFTKEEFYRVMNLWEREEYKIPEDVLNALFSEKRVFDDSQKELVRITVLNQFYSTNLHNVELLSIANYLSKKSDDLNKLLECNSEQAVAMIARSSKDVNSNHRLHYVFATKYCSFVAPNSNDYPIFDSIVGGFYLLFREEWQSENDSIPDDVFKSPSGNVSLEAIKKQYCQYKTAVKALMTKFTWIDSVKKLDQYLWMAMKDKGQYID